MGKSSRRRRKRQRKKRSEALAKVRPPGAIRVGVRAEQLELALAHDGFLRGSPEPALLVGVYRVSTAAVETVGRFLYRFERPGGVPAKVFAKEHSKESVVVAWSADVRVVFIVLAIEEDSGRGLQSLYGELENGETVVAWLEQDSSAVPVPLGELVSGVLPRDSAHGVHLVFGDRDPSRELQGDDWVGAGMVWANIDSGRQRHRLRFLSPDGRNDWTAELELAVQRA